MLEVNSSVRLGYQFPIDCKITDVKRTKGESSIRRWDRRTLGLQ